jgi:hypothetical protein
MLCLNPVTLAVSVNTKDPRLRLRSPIRLESKVKRVAERAV